jgi:hypothetical protein
MAQGNNSGQAVPITEIRQYPLFGLEIQELEDGGMMLMMTTAIGIQHRFPFTQKQRKELGHIFTAPHVIRPGG